MSSSSRPPQSSPQPRRHWLVAFTVGIFRGLGNFLSSIATWLERKPDDPKASAGVWGVLLVAIVAAWIGWGRMGSSVPVRSIEVAADPATEEIAIAEPIATIDESIGQEPGDNDENPDRDRVEIVPEESQPEESSLADEPPIVEPAIADESEVEEATAQETAIDDAEESDEDNLDTENVEATEEAEEAGTEDDSEFVAVPTELTAPEATQTLEPAPLPLTPEQRLIAELQARIAIVSDEFAADEIVSTVRVDFVRNHLDVTVSDRWYDLADDEQDRVADELRDRGTQFDFYDLDLLDELGRVVARPALLGEGTIVVRRLRD